MNLKKLKEQLIIDEGVRYEVYLDHLGFPTCGIGHLLTKKDPELSAYLALPKGGKLTVSVEKVNNWFEEDIKIVLNDCNKLFSQFNSFCEELQLIIANMMFNLGLTRLSKFKNFKKAIEDLNYKKASLEMVDSLWYKQVPNRAKRLVKRMESLANDQLCKV